MDIQDFWEENKRWLLSVLLGIVAFFFARSMVQFEDTGARRAQSAIASQLSEERYTAAVVTDALAEGEALQREMDRLLEAMVFEPAAEFVIDLTRPDAPEVQFNNAQQSLVRRLEDRAADHGVDVERRNVQWITAQTPEERRRTLVGMALLDAAMERLFAAHRQVREADPTARGVTSIRMLRIGDGQRRQPFAGMRGGRQRGVDASQYLSEETLEFHLEVDSPTTALWLEACRGDANPMSLSEFTAEGPKSAGDPVVLKGRLAAVTFDSERFEEDLANASQEESR